MSVIADTSMREEIGWTEAVARSAPVLILGYLALHAVLRITVPGGLAIDEAEQMVAAQSLEPGYGRQPPLYNWLQWAVFQITGAGKPGLALLKNTVLASAYLGLWTLARRAGATETGAAVAMAGALFIPTWIWHAHHDLTHSILVASLTLWCLVAVLRALDDPGPGRFVLVGVLAAAGLLAKWNFAFLLGGLALALALDPRARNIGWALSGLVMLVLVAGPAVWAITHSEDTLSGLGKLGVETAPLVSRWIDFAAGLAEGILSDLALLFVVVLAVFRIGSDKTMASPPSPDQGLVERTVWFGLLLIVVASLATGFTAVRARWLLPLVILVPVVLSLRLEPGFTQRRVGILFGMAGALMISALVLVPVTMSAGFGKPPRQSAPFDAAATEIGLRDQTVLVSDMWLGGNLLLVRPDLTVVSPDLAVLRDAPRADLAIWAHRDAPRPNAPAPLRALVAEAGTGANRTAQKSAAFAYPSPHGDHQFHIHWEALH